MNIALRTLHQYGMAALLAASACALSGQSAQVAAPEKLCGDGPLKECVARADTLTDKPRAAALYLEACLGGEPSACVKIGDGYKYGKGVAKSPEQAAAAYQRACKGMAMAGCYSLASAYYFGQGVAQNKDRAHELWNITVDTDRHDCEKGVLIACRRVAEHLQYAYPGWEDKPQALLYFRKGCDGGDAESCDSLGRFLNGGNNGIARDPAAADAAFVRGCALGSSADCNIAGTRLVYGRPEGGGKDYRKAIPLLEKGCAAGDAGCCDRLAFLYRDGGTDNNGYTVAQDAAKYADYYKQACAKGMSINCPK